MTPQTHAILGLALILVSLVAGVWARIRARQGHATGRPLGITVAVAGVLLLVQVLVGADLWARGARPAASPWAEIHLILPILTLIQFVVFLARPKTGAAQTRRWSIATLSTAGVALLSYAIGQIGN